MLPDDLFEGKSFYYGPRRSIFPPVLQGRSLNDKFFHTPWAAEIRPRRYLQISISLQSIFKLVGFAKALRCPCPAGDSEV